MTVLTKRLAAVAALLILAGCGDATEAEKPPAPTPAETLKKAVPAASAEVFHYAVKGGNQAFSGVLDAPNKGTVIEINEKIPEAGFTLSMKLMVVGEDSWAKVSFGDA